MKKLGILLATIVMAMMFVVSASALEPTGQCGDNVYWVYDEKTKDLIIYGEGAMYNLEELSSITSPFYESDIDTIIIQEGVTSIGNQMFAFCRNLNSISIADSVERIGDYAFNHSSLINVELPDNLIYIGRYAFYYCGSLESINLDSNIEVIGDCAFNGCSKIKNIQLGANLTSVGLSAFACENLKRIDVNEDNLMYSNDSFGVLFDKSKTILIQYPIGNMREKYIMPNSVKEIGNNAFRGCDSIKEVVVSKNVVEIGWSAFYHCNNLNKINIPIGVTSVKSGTFSSCVSLSSIELPESITNIESTAFYGCINLLHITMTRNIKKIDEYAFDSCEKLKDVYYDGIKEEWNEIKIALGNSCLINASIHCHEHIYNFQITTSATHLTEGVKTFTCKCGDSYTEAIEKTTEHTYTSEVTKEATHLTRGETTYTCACGDTYTEAIPKLDKHTHIPTITIPTCTTQGYTTYTCECGDTYVADYVDANGHTYTSYVTDPTCTAQGLKVNICSCGDNYTETLPAKGHTFSGSVCTTCGYDKADMCSCNCHKSGLSALLWKLLNILYKLLRLNKVCACGIAHY